MRDSAYPLLKETGCTRYQVGVETIDLVVDPKYVFPPSETSLALSEAISRFRPNSMLDIGTGSGIISIAAAKAGCRSILAIDINPKAVECAAGNAKRNGVSDKVRCELVDVLTWETAFRFDLIASNPPFMPMPADARFISDEIELAIRAGLDGTAMLIAFGEKAASLLTAEGRYVFGLPHFVDHLRVTHHLSSFFDMSVLFEKRIRYWLAEYDKRFATHIRALAGGGVADLFADDERLVTILSIYECRLRSQVKHYSWGS